MNLKKMVIELQESVSKPQFKTIKVEADRSNKDLIKNDLILFQINQFSKSFAPSLANDENGLPPIFIYLAKGAKTTALEIKSNFEEIQNRSNDSSFEFCPVKYTFYDGTTRLEKPKRVAKKKYSYPDVKGRKVIFIDDIQDSGETAALAVQEAREQGADVTDFIFLLEKPEEENGKQIRTVEWPEGVHKHVLFTIPGVWVEGFGLDTNGRGRRNKDIIVRWDKMYPKAPLVRRIFRRGDLPKVA